MDVENFNCAVPLAWFSQKCFGIVIFLANENRFHFYCVKRYTETLLCLPGNGLSVVLQGVNLFYDKRRDGDTS